MSQYSNNNEITDASSSKPQLCRKCCEFFANQDTEFLCSKCYKQANKVPLTKPVETKVEQFIKPVEKIEEEKSNVVEQCVSSTSESKKEQVDHKKCFICPKKTGSLGHQCKCGFTFCKSHRLPEDHECSFNFKEEATKKLTKENPLVVASKMQRI